MTTNTLTDLLGLRFLSSDAILSIITDAKSYKKNLTASSQQSQEFNGKTLVNMFFEPSTRTRVSFEMAIKKLGANSISISPETSSLKKGESIYDSVKNLQSMGIDGIVVRHPHAGLAKFISEHLNIPVINAGDGYTEHPTQGLLDIMTMLEHCNSLKGKKVLILGDIMHSRVARSNIWGLLSLGAEVTVCGPPTLMPRGLKEMGVEIAGHIEECLADQDFVNVLRIQYERQDMSYFPSIREYKSRYSLSTERLNKLKKEVTILHPGPINRGIEIDSEVADGTHNVILDQVTNGVAVRMAVISRLLSRRPEK